MVRAQDGHGDRPRLNLASKRVFGKIPEASDGDRQTMVKLQGFWE